MLSSSSGSAAQEGCAWNHLHARAWDEGDDVGRGDVEYSSCLVRAISD
jgi:hypothetical protein